MLVRPCRPAASPRRPPSTMLASAAVSAATATTSSATPSAASATESAARTAPQRADFRTQLTQFGAGALAGLVNTLVLSPLDVVKTRLQAQSGLGASTGGLPGGATRYTGLVHALRSMLREEGLRSYYRGLSASMWAFVPNWAIYWYTYETCKRLYARPDRRPSPLVHVLSALTAGGITAVTTAPFWTLKSRLQVASIPTSAPSVAPPPPSAPASAAAAAAAASAAAALPRLPTLARYRSVPHGFRTIVREEGVSGLYKGLTPTLLGLGHVAIQFPLYEHLKSRLAGRHRATHGGGNDPGELRAEHVLIASSLSKVAASSVFYPHEVLRTRIQVDTTVVRRQFELVRVANLLRDIVRRDGARGLYRGFGANLVRTVPACMLTFTSYELAKRFAERRRAAAVITSGNAAADAVAEDKEKDKDEARS